MATVPVTTGLFTVDGDGAGRLLGGSCRACGRPHFPRLPTCPWCSSDDVEDTTLSDHGTLWGWTAVTAAPPGYRGEVPFGFGVVELPEGLRVVTRLTEADPARLRSGQPVRLVVVPLHTDEAGDTVVTYAFAPAGEPS
ncbi:MAG: Zn-ribbon domain-containing OB-fold protein [Acidimicrobiia bacterium]|nr:Zn-ribbon domain-containing OB-fold protein [Acidimicrobiia bacterium]